MKLSKATEADFQRITQFYRDAIAHTKHMDRYARWTYGQYPTDEMNRGYPGRQQDVLCQRDRRAYDPLRLGSGGGSVHSRNETGRTAVKRTHIPATSAYLQPGYACKIGV